MRYKNNKTKAPYLLLQNIAGASKRGDYFDVLLYIYIYIYKYIYLPKAKDRYNLNWLCLINVLTSLDSL